MQDHNVDFGEVGLNISNIFLYIWKDFMEKCVLILK